MLRITACAEYVSEMYIFRIVFRCADKRDRKIYQTIEIFEQSERNVLYTAIDDQRGYRLIGNVNYRSMIFTVKYSVVDRKRLIVRRNGYRGYIFKHFVGDIIDILTDFQFSTVSYIRNTSNSICFTVKINGIRNITVKTRKRRSYDKFVFRLAQRKD